MSYGGGVPGNEECVIKLCEEVEAFSFILYY
jgi:hypothetical protein